MSEFKTIKKYRESLSKGSSINSNTTANSSQSGASESAVTVDVYGSDEYLWYTSTTPDDKKQIPYVVLQEFENRTELLSQRILYIRSGAFDASTIQDDKNFTQIYKDLYQVRPTKTVYRFPYFGKYPFSITTTYSQIDIKNSDGLGEEIAKIRTSADNADMSLIDFADRIGAGLKARDKFAKDLQRINSGESPDSVFGFKGFSRRFGVTQGAQAIKSWASAETGQYETTFNLINRTPELAKKHYEFIRNFMRALAPSFPNTMMVKVPYVYEIFIPSVLHIPLGFIGNFSATPKGSSFIVKKGSTETGTEQGMIVPEAWEIHVTFNSLFPISKQLLDTINDDYGRNYGFRPGTTAIPVMTNDTYIQSIMPDPPPSEPNDTYIQSTT